MRLMNEWEFTGDVSSWINEIIAYTPIPPFHRSKVEQTGTGSRKRRDLTLLDKSKRALITGEIKLPYQADGNSPHITKVVKDARKKARRAKARFFFTWNVNECVLWETEPADPSKLGLEYRSWHVTNVHNAAQLEHRATEDEIQLWLIKFLHAVARILEGAETIGRKPPDVKFIEALESSLRMPIQFTYNELDALCSKKRERVRIEKWMREDQGWTIYDDAERIRENLERASRFTCYALVNKLVFHEALLKKYGKRLKKLRVPDSVDTGEQLWIHLEGYFKEAIEVTGDYETVFGEEHRSVGNRIPFHSDEAVPLWRALIDEIHEFDFTKLDHEVIGSLFERLLSPEERHKYGQYYTRVEIVDLINSFCIRQGNEKVM
ncbi:MAG: SAM-dependent methyltransferase, partial [candidate division Zixibacteria bacterium]|nr:SAM-dependent methyltransferase [candidate division Zixibacteria bacterium]